MNLQWHSNNAEASSLYETPLQGIVVLVRTKKSTQSKMTNTCNYHDSLQARLLEGIGHITLCKIRFVMQAWLGSIQRWCVCHSNVLLT